MWKNRPGRPVVQDNRSARGGRFLLRGTGGQAEAAVAGAVVVPPEEEAEEVLPSEPDDADEDFAEELLPVSTDDDAERESVR